MENLVPRGGAVSWDRVICGKNYQKPCPKKRRLLLGHSRFIGVVYNGLSCHFLGPDQKAADVYKKRFKVLGCAIKGKEHAK